MERVQFEQEQMLPELKDLVQKGVFSERETKQIMRKRTTFETALVRRVTKKSDFLRYIGYEMNLEALRRKRVSRLNLPHSPMTISDYAIVRRQFKLFERALRKFKDDVGLWIQYIRLAKREKAKALVGRITVRALKLHPTHPSLYILAASHELTHLSSSAARTLLQRGLRLNPESVDLWREYMKMELGFVESLRRRWELLGVDKDRLQVSGDSEMVDEDGSSVEHEFQQEKARKEILGGALVKAVIDNAIESLPTLPLLNLLHNTILSYPIPSTLRTELLDHFFRTIEATPSLNSSPEVVKMHATRSLYDGIEGPKFVDELRHANEELLEKAKNAKGQEKEGLARVYASFVQEWVQKDIDENLIIYLTTSLQSLISTPSKASVPLLITHLRLLSSNKTPTRLQHDKLLKLARKYTSKASQSSELWLLRLEIEAENTEFADWSKIWEEARTSVSTGLLGSEEEQVWLWGLDRIASQPIQERITTIQVLLSQSLPLSASILSSNLLMKYVELLQAQAQQERDEGTYKEMSLAKHLAHMVERYLPTEEVWQHAFDLFYKSSEDEAIVYSDKDESDSEESISPPMSTPHSDLPVTLQTIYTHWRTISPSAHGRAALAYGSYLLHSGQGNDVAAIITGARVVLPQDERATFEMRWKAIVDGTEEKEGGSSEGEEGDQDIGMEE